MAGNYYKKVYKPKCFEAILAELNINQPVVTPILSTKDMVLNFKYAIKSAKRIQTEFGYRIILLVEDPKFEFYNLFLPERFKDISQNILARMNAGELNILNQGPMGKSYVLLFDKN